MGSIKPTTIMMAVQAVQAKIDALLADAGGDVSEMDPDMQELLVSYEKSAEDLKKAYVEDAKTYLTLPAYEELIGQI